MLYNCFESLILFINYVGFAGFAEGLDFDFGSYDDEEDSNVHPYGTPLNIMSINNNETIQVDYDSVDRIFLHPDVADRKVVVISIVGALRKGKSFFLDYCLRFMYGNVSNTGVST